MRRVDSAGVAVASLWGRAESVSGHDTGEEAAECRLLEIREASERGYRDGYSQGEEDAREQARLEAEASNQRREQELGELRRQLESSRKRFDSLVESLSSALDRQASQVGEMAVDIAFAAVTKFLGDRYADRELMQGLIDHALAHVEGHVDSLRVSEQDLPLVQGVDAIRIIGEARLLPGQCTLETRFGHYETGLDVRLELLKNALLSGLARHRSEEQAP